MTIDISNVAWMVRRMDASATLKTFVAIFAVLAVPLLLIVYFAALAELLAEGFFDLWEPDDAVFLVATVVASLLSLATPLLFILQDWIARQPWRVLAAINGALLGAVCLAIVAALLGFMAAGAAEEIDFELREQLIAGSLLGLVAVLLTAWMVVTEPRKRRILRYLSAGLGIIAIGIVTYAIYPELEFESALEVATAALTLAFYIAAVVAIVGVIVRAIRNRIVLAGNAPRGLLLGDFHRKSFWTRMAFLVGLPSSMWHARAMRSLAFWAFLLARPVTYVGVLIGLGDTWQVIGLPMQFIAGGVLVIGGHLMFVGAKKLAAAYSWVPDRPGDSRPPILFLRSFEDDQLRFRRRWWQLHRRWLDLWSFRRNVDEAMIDEIAQYGPVVALGMPGESKVPFGASRYYASHEDWQQIVGETARKAAAIVIAAGDTPGVRWEYEFLTRNELLDETMLLFPPDDSGGSKGRAALAAFREATGSGESGGLEANDHLIALIPSAGSSPLLLTAKSADSAAYLAAIRGFIQERSPAELADPLDIPAGL